MRISDWSSDVCSSDLLFHFTLKLPLPLQQLLQLVDDLGLAATEQSRNLGQTLLFVGNVGQCRRAGHRLDAANARRDTTFRQYLEQADIAGMAYVGAATQLGREFAHAQHPHPLAVFRSEEHTSEIQSLLRISYAVFCL